jgi:putative ABC transport system ATP-binding protein
MLITHEHDIAEYATRVISFLDGQLVMDSAVGRRRLAAEELKALPQESVA